MSELDVADLQRLGYLPLQHHEEDQSGGDWPENTKALLYGTRIVGVDPATGDWQEDPLRGPVASTLVWSEDPASPRTVPFWLLGGAPSVVTGPPAQLNDAMFPGPTVRPAVGEDPGGWAPDPGLREETPRTPFGLRFPKTYPGLTVAGTDLREQQELFLPGAIGMIAVHEEGQAQAPYGSYVWDVDDTGALSMLRRARFHSLARVYEIPLTGNGFFLPPIFGGGHGLAWQLGLSADRSAGRGMVADTGGFGIEIDRNHDVAQGGSDYDRGAENYLAGIMAHLARHLIEDKGTTYDPRVQVLAAGSVWAGGPFDVGDDQGFCEHHFSATTGLIESIKSLHLSTLSLFRMPGGFEDAPLEFRSEPYEPPAGNIAALPGGTGDLRLYPIGVDTNALPYTIPVYCRYDDVAEHVWMGRRMRGLWRWETEGAFYVSTGTTWGGF